MKEQKERLLLRYPQLKLVEAQIWDAYHLLETCYENGNRVYVCGNGGSASDCEHIVGELMKSFRLARPLPDEEKAKWLAGQEEDTAYQKLVSYLQQGLPAISLVSQHALMTAISNDIGSEYIFAQQLYAYAKPGDVLFGISTSGNSDNVVMAVLTAKAMGVKTLILSGHSGGKLVELADVCICCPADKTEEIQELHLPVYHTLCAMLECRFWKGRNE